MKLQLQTLGESDPQRDMWLQTFESVTRFSVLSLEPAWPEKWTERRQSFQTCLRVELKADAPYCRWEQGGNTRFVALTQVDGAWRVDSPASSP